MRKIIFAIIIVLGVIFVYLNRTEVQEIIETIQQGDLRYIGIAFGVEFLWLLTVAASFWFVYRALGLDEKFKKLVQLTVGANFVNVVAPSVGVGGLAVFISEAKRRGYSSARVTVAGAVVVMFDYMGFIFVLAMGLVVLVRRNNLNTPEITASIIMVILAVLWGSFLYLGMKSEQSLGRFLAWMARQVNRVLRPFLRREYLSEARAYSFASDTSEGLFILRQHPSNLMIPGILGLMSKLLLVLILYLVFLAFNVPYSPGTIVAGFSIGYLFWIVSPTPAGIGFVEGAMALGLTSLNVPLGAATVLALAYRGITFWIPMLFGALTLRWLARDEKSKEPESEGRQNLDKNA